MGKYFAAKGGLLNDFISLVSIINFRRVDFLRYWVLVQRCHSVFDLDRTE